MNNLLSILTNIEFGMNEALGIIILVIAIGLVISEIRSKKAGDLLTNIIISLLLFGVSIYNLVSIGFKASSIIITICYVIVIILAIIYTVLLILHSLKYKKESSELEEDKETNEEIIEDDTNQEK